MSGFIGPGAAFSPGADWLQGLRRPRPGHAHRALHRFGRRRFPSARPDGSDRPVALPEARLGHGRRHRLGAIVAPRCRSCSGGAGATIAGVAGHPGSRVSSWACRRGGRGAAADRGDRRSKAYDYMMHDNDFCKGCHIFVPSGQAFVRPDTGTYLLVNKMEGTHDSLSCHACHPFELEGPDQGAVLLDRGAPGQGAAPCQGAEGDLRAVPQQGAAKKTWQRIATTAGHRIHLESDSSALKDVACLTCHARSAHRFQPADTTCAQKGCHLTDEVKIRLGRMAARFTPENLDPNEEQLYCNSCHQFTAEAQFVTLDSAEQHAPPGPGAVLRLPRDARRSCHVRSRQGPSRRKLRDVPQPPRGRRSRGCA